MNTQNKQFSKSIEGNHDNSEIIVEPEPSSESRLQFLNRVDELTKGHLEHGFRLIFRDIEIDKNNLLYLLLLLVATLFLAETNFYYSGDLIDRTRTFGGSAFSLGLIFGLFIGGMIVDRLQHRVPLLILILIISPVLNILGIFLRQFAFVYLPLILFSLSTVLITIAILLDMVIILQYTSRIERGRVIAILMSFIAVFTIIFYFIISKSSLAILPNLFPLFVAGYLYVNREKARSAESFAIFEYLTELRKKRRNWRKIKHLKRLAERKKKRSLVINKENKPDINSKQNIIIDNSETNISVENDYLLNRTDGSKDASESSSHSKGQKHLNKEISENKSSSELKTQIKEIHEKLISEIQENFKLKRTTKQFFNYLYHSPLIFRYMLIIFAGGMLVGLLIPITQFVNQIIITEESNLIELRPVLLSSPIFIIVGAFLIGLFFDFYGRKRTMAFMIFVVGIVNFFRIFQAEQLDITSNIGVFSGLIFSFFLSILLITGDLVSKEFWSRILAMNLVMFAIGLLFGIIIKDQLIIDLLNHYPLLQQQLLTELPELEGILYYNYSISSTIFLLCIIILFILSTIQNDTTKEEQNWPKSLIHMYIVHQSGLMLYEHVFQKEEGLAEADLISGGLIGLVSLLQEITKGNQNLRVIDHGDKKLLFQWDSNKQVVVVLIVKHDLRILRYKLSRFTRDFESKFKHQLENFVGVSEHQWKSVKQLVFLHFSRKYMNWLWEEPNEN